MFDIYLRNLKDAITEPLAILIAKLAKHKVSPNLISCISGIFGLILVYFSAMNKPRIAFFFWFLNRFFDGLDGTYARRTNQTSDLGGYLDILIDFTIYGLIPVGVTYGSETNQCVD